MWSLPRLGATSGSVLSGVGIIGKQPPGGGSVRHSWLQPVASASFAAMGGSSRLLLSTGDDTFPRMPHGAPRCLALDVDGSVAMGCGSGGLHVWRSRGAPPPPPQQQQQPPGPEGSSNHRTTQEDSFGDGGDGGASSSGGGGGGGGGGSNVNDADADGGGSNAAAADDDDDDAGSWDWHPAVSAQVFTSPVRDVALTGKAALAVSGDEGGSVCIWEVLAFGRLHDEAVACGMKTSSSPPPSPPPPEVGLYKLSSVDP